jgi:hypothetical protein
VPQRNLCESSRCGTGRRAKAGGARRVLRVGKPGALNVLDQLGPCHYGTYKE